MTRPVKKVEPPDGVLVANSARARLFARDPDNAAMRELASFVHPRARMKTAQLGHDRAGQALKGEAHTAFEPHTEPHRKERAAFAHELAQRLEEETQRHRFPQVAVFASDPFLGELKAQLGATAQRRLLAAVALDLTAYDGAELEHRVAQALAAAKQPGDGG